MMSLPVMDSAPTPFTALPPSQRLPSLLQSTTTPCGQTDRCGNITLSQTSFAGGENIEILTFVEIMRLILRGDSAGFHGNP